MRALARKLSLTPRHCAASQVFRRTSGAGAFAGSPSQGLKSRVARSRQSGGSAATGSPRIVTGMSVSVTSGRPRMRSLSQSLRSGPFGRLSALARNMRKGVGSGCLCHGSSPGLRSTGDRHRLNTPVAYGSSHDTIPVICRVIASGAFEVSVCTLSACPATAQNREWLARSAWRRRSGWLIASPPAALFPPRTPVW